MAHRWLSERNLTIGLLLVMASALFLAACNAATPEPAVRVETVVATQPVTPVPVVVTVVKTRLVTGTPTPTPTPAPTPRPVTCCDDYRIGIFKDPDTTNYWAHLGRDYSVWTEYVLYDQPARLYTLSDQRFDFVPSLAVDLPPEPVPEGDRWTVTVEMVDDALWSDGQPVTARDVAFTLQTCLDLRLQGEWPDRCRPDALVGVKAVDEYTVEFTFSQTPTLDIWHYGVAQAPILPEHYWAPMAAEARALFPGDARLTEEEPEEPGYGATAEEQAAYEAAQAAYEEARAPFEAAWAMLYEPDGLDAPVFGAYYVQEFEVASHVLRVRNPRFYFEGAHIVEYADGMWVMEQPNGRRLQLYGKAQGEVTLDFVRGPYSERIVFKIYGDQDAALVALGDGEVDHVLNPFLLRCRHIDCEKALRDESLVYYWNLGAGLHYLAFNLRREPMSDPAFRQAVELLIDREFVDREIFGGVVVPAYSIVPIGDVFWHHPSLGDSYAGFSRQERLALAVQTLKEAGYTWAVEPGWDSESEAVRPGEGLLLPNGEPVPALSILGPGTAYDPLQAEFNQQITVWMRDLGIPVQSYLTGWDIILDRVFTYVDYDMCVVGWNLVTYPDYLCEFFHSAHGALVDGKLVGDNAPGLADAEFDAACEMFLAETDIVRAQALAFQVQGRLAELRPYIPLFYKQIADVARNNVEFPYTTVLGGIEGMYGFQTDVQVLFPEP